MDERVRASAFSAANGGARVRRLARHRPSPRQSGREVCAVDDSAFNTLGAFIGSPVEGEGNSIKAILPNPSKR